MILQMASAQGEDGSEPGDEFNEEASEGHFLTTSVIFSLTCEIDSIIYRLAKLLPMEVIFHMCEQN